MDTKTVYELRQYRVVPGRIDVALERFQHHLPAIFARHGIRNVGRWTVSAGSAGPGFAYLMAYHDLAERERVWASFYQDAEWWDLRGRTQGAEEATDRYDIHFLRRSAIWPARPVTIAARAGVHDLQFAEVALGKQAAAERHLQDEYLPLIEALGGEIMLVADFIAGPAMPRIALMFAWCDAAARQSGWHRILADDKHRAILQAQRAEFGQALLGRTDSWLLEPTPELLPDESFA